MAWFALTTVCLAGASATACESEHPPVVASPQGELVARDSQGDAALTWSVDPRGIGDVVLADDPPGAWIDAADPTGAWHYREWQWWKGHPWGDSCRPRYFADVQFRLPRREEPAAVISYRIDGFDCRQTFFAPPAVDRDAPYSDLVTTIRNASGQAVEEYGQFFACYTPLNRTRSFWYWDESGQLVLLSDRGVTHLNGFVAHPAAYFQEQGAVPHCPRGGGKIVGRWRRPVMLSQASPGGWRSVILLDAEHAASIAQGIEGGAMDYILFPGPQTPTFAGGAEFSTHIRHVMLKSPELPEIARLEALWKDFERSHEAVYRSAGSMTKSVLE